MEQTDRVAVRNLIISVLFGVVLSRFSIGAILMTVPVLLACPKVRQTSIRIAAYAAMLLGVAVWTLIQNRAIFGTGYGALLLVNLYMPTAMVVGSAVWTVGGDYSSSSMRKFFWACIPVFFIGLALALYFASSSSQPIRDALVESVMYYFPTDILEVDVSSAVKLVVDSMKLVFAPVGILLLAIPIVVSDVNLHRYDEDWQYDFANMKLPDAYVWVFFGSWAAALVCRLVKTMPAMVTTVAWNLALSISVLYFIVGVSIFMAFMRRRTAVMTAGRVVFTVVLACFIPGLNVAVVLVLPLLAVLETWVRFR